jgi:dipeptidyl-peptidase-4
MSAGHLICRAAAFLTALVATVPVVAQERPLTLDVIYDPIGRVDFSGAPEVPRQWLDDNTYLVVDRVREGRASEWYRVNALSGEATPFFDQTRMEDALAVLPGVSRAEAARQAYSGLLTLNPTGTGVLTSIEEDLYFYDFGTGNSRRLTTVDNAEEEATFSPDGKSVAFIRNNDLYVVDVATSNERRLTTDGGPQLLNGKLDWLYQEEIYGRGRFRAYWWSPDSAHLAFLQLAEDAVPEYTVVDHLPYRPTLEVTAYPKAGDTNPTVRLGIAARDGSALSFVSQDGFSLQDILIVNVDWTPSGSAVLYQVQDREQTWLTLTSAPVDGSEQTLLLTESGEAWVNSNGNPTWLEDGTFLWFSERSGFRHLYRYASDGTELGQVTSGRWDVRTLYGVDEAAGVLYFASRADSPIGTDLYRAGLDGSTPVRLSTRDGVNRAIFNASMTLYVGVWSDVTTPTQVRLHDADGTELRVLDANPVAALSEYRLVTPEFLQVETRDGFVMEAMMIKPPDFDPARQYPVFQYVYSGPGLSSVRNQWNGRQYMFHQLLAQQGMIVWILDNRSASGKGVESQWPVYKRLGEVELQDLEDGLVWLQQQPYVDPDRVVMSGWSYGGFMTAYALTHSTGWSAGIAGAPVTDWRNYDTVYTERYMGTPQNNPDGYRNTAPTRAAANISGRLLLLHGAIDDNVHMQNSIQFAYALQDAGKPFEMMIYPRSRHGVTNPDLSLHLQRTTFDFVLRATGLRLAQDESR